MNTHMDGWKVSFDGTRAKLVTGPCWAVVTYFRSYDGREVPDSRVVESLHHEQPRLDRLQEKYLYPAAGSVKQYDFAYHRMAACLPARPRWWLEAGGDNEDGLEEGYVACDARDLPGVEKVYRKVEVARLTTDELRELYLEWARTHVVKEAETPAMDFALHVLAELGGEPEGRSERRYSELVRPSRRLAGR